MTKHVLLDPAFQARGRGTDRRHIITIDGRNYKPQSPQAVAAIVQRMTAKQLAREWFWCCLELATMGLFFAAGALWLIIAHEVW
jgi:hypothetical protein